MSNLKKPWNQPHTWLGIRNFIIILFVLVLAFASAPMTLHAQPQLTPAQAIQTPPLDPASIPPYGSFYSYQHLSSGKPYPPVPRDPFLGTGLDVPVYSMGGGAYLLGDQDVDYAAFDAAKAQANQSSMASPSRTSISLPTLPGGSGITQQQRNPVWAAARRTRPAILPTRFTWRSFVRAPTRTTPTPTQ